MVNEKVDKLESYIEKAAEKTVSTLRADIEAIIG